MNSTIGSSTGKRKSTPENHGTQQTSNVQNNNEDVSQVVSSQPNNSVKLPPKRTILRVIRTPVYGRIAQRGSGFTIIETDFLLSTLKDIQPLCGDEWEMVLCGDNL